MSARSKVLPTCSGYSRAGRAVSPSRCFSLLVTVSCNDSQMPCRDPLKGFIGPRRGKQLCEANKNARVAKGVDTGEASVDKVHDGAALSMKQMQPSACKVAAGNRQKTCQRTNSTSRPDSAAYKGSLALLSLGLAGENDGDATRAGRRPLIYRSCRGQSGQEVPLSSRNRRRQYRHLIQDGPVWG